MRLTGFSLSNIETKMTYRTLRLIFCFTLYTISPCLHAQTDVDDFNEKLKAHTRVINARESKNAYGHVMRRLFLAIRYGKTYGLPESDVRIIEEFDGKTTSQWFTRARVAMQPYMDEIARGIEEKQSAAYLAYLLEQAGEAEEESNNEFYKDIAMRLSPEGQRRLTEIYHQELQRVQIPVTDHVSLAHEEPERMLFLIKSGVANFRMADTGIGDSIRIQTLGDNKENNNEQ